MSRYPKQGGSNRKVKHGTPIHSQSSLCKTCRHATIMQGLAESQEITYCGSVDKNIFVKIHECSAYIDKRLPSLYDMQQIAWNICTDKSGKRIGFLSPQDFRKRGKDVSVEGTPIDNDYY